MRRSAWGLSTPTDEGMAWDRLARCAEPDVDPELWSTPSGTAVHMCRRHCKVRSQCRQDVLANPRNVKGTVRHGVFYGGTIEQPKPAVNQPHDPGCPSCGGMGEMAVVQEQECPGCGGSFYPSHPHMRYCDTRCQRDAEYRRRGIGRHRPEHGEADAHPTGSVKHRVKHQPALK